MSSKTSPRYIICDSPQIFRPKPERVHRIKIAKDFFYKKPKTFNLDLISENEIKNDFDEFKSKSEEIKAQKELIYLIKKCKKEKKNKNNMKYKRPERQPLYNNVNNLDVVI